MSVVERAHALPGELLEWLSLALDASDPARAVREALCRGGLPEATRERVLERVLLVGRRARQCEPRASACELELSLGVILVLCGALPRDTARS